MKVQIERLSKYAGWLVAVISVLMFSACGGGGGDAEAPSVLGLSGSVVQGKVSGAKVWADHLTGAGANSKMDADEAATAATTATDGTFTLPTTPAYDHILVSSGGVDSITGKPAQHMQAPAGSSVISPFTTMVVMEPACEAVIEGLGVDARSDVSKSVTPAALFLLQSVQAVMTTLTTALDPAGNKLTEDQLNKIQREVMKQVAAQVKTQSAAQLITPDALTAILQTALNDALVKIVADPDNSNLTIPSTTALAGAAVTPLLITTVANACDPTGRFSTSPNDAKGEHEYITDDKAAAINMETDKKGKDAEQYANVTPKGNNPPTISGTPATSVFVGETYEFRPDANDKDGDSLTFSIVGRPPWASFNAASGKLKGTPTEADVGTYAGIVISVTDRVSTASLPAFSITVQPVTGATGSGGGGGY